jgi:hypothetical protein
MSTQQSHDRYRSVHPQEAHRKFRGNSDRSPYSDANDAFLIIQRRNPYTSHRLLTNLASHAIIPYAGEPKQQKCIFSQF